MKTKKSVQTEVREKSSVPTPTGRWGFIFPDANGLKVRPKSRDFLRFTPKAFHNTAQGRGASPRTLGQANGSDRYPERVTQRRVRICVTLSG